MVQFTVKSVGRIRVSDEGMVLELDKEYAPALTGLEDFSHIQVLWWANGCDNAQSRAQLTFDSPYKGSPAVMGAFATRSPERPNPIALTCAQVTYIDEENAVIGLAFIDAQDGTPVLDIKPYTPSFDRVEAPNVPMWCAAWPQSTEKSGDFDWEDVFNF